MIVESSAVLTLVFALGLTVAQQVPQCGSCQAANDASCESETSYYNCFNGKKYGDLVQCKTGTVCSNAANICVEKQQLTSAIVNVCSGASGVCNDCSQNNRYTCVSRRQAARCIDSKVAAVVNCGTDEICVVDAQKDNSSVCMPQCAADYMKRSATCTNDVYPIPTPAPTTTPAPAERESICKAASAGVSTLYFYTYFDNTCKSAVYCQRSLTSTDWVTLFRSCPASTPYFDTRLRSCVTAKPANCLNTTTTVAATTANASPTTTAISDTTTGATSQSTTDSTTDSTTRSTPDTTAASTSDSTTRSTTDITTASTSTSTA